MPAWALKGYGEGRGQGALDAIKSALGIASPSKVFPATGRRHDHGRHRRRHWYRHAQGREEPRSTSRGAVGSAAKALDAAQGHQRGGATTAGRAAAAVYRASWPRLPFWRSSSTTRQSRSAENILAFWPRASPRRSAARWRAVSAPAVRAGGAANVRRASRGAITTTFTAAYYGRILTMFKVAYATADSAINTQPKFAERGQDPGRGPEVGANAIAALADLPRWRGTTRNVCKTKVAWIVSRLAEVGAWMNNSAFVECGDVC